MNPRRQEKSLRRLVAGLAHARPEDVDAVLDELSPDHRRVVGELLEAYRGAPHLASRPAAPTGDTIDLDGFSPAVAERLRPSDGAQPQAWRMTGAAAGALRTCAQQTLPEPPLLTVPIAADRRHSWFLGRAR